MRHFLLVAGLGFCIVSSASADDIAVSERTFGCILDWPQVRNTRIKHSDPEQLKEAMRIFRDSIPDTAYPVGTILQLVPYAVSEDTQDRKSTRLNSSHGS